jgi:hypothetical protein
MPKEFDLDKLFITIIDSDSIAPVDYIDHVNSYIYKNPDRAYKTVLHPNDDLQTQRYGRSYSDPNFRPFPLPRPLHLNCVGLRHCPALLELHHELQDSQAGAGFWDKGKDSVAEDNHNFSKMFWTTNGDAYGVPIYTPFIQANIQSGDNLSG